MIEKGTDKHRDKILGSIILYKIQKEIQFSGRLIFFWRMLSMWLILENMDGT